MSLKIYIVEAPLSGAAGLGGHLEGGRQQSIDRVEAVLCSAGALGHHGNCMVAQSKPTICREQSQSGFQLEPP